MLSGQAETTVDANVDMCYGHALRSLSERGRENQNNTVISYQIVTSVTS